MIDKVTDIVLSKSATHKMRHNGGATFQGHFPVMPIMPGVLIVEAMAQTAAVLVVHSTGDDQGEGRLLVDRQCPFPQARGARDVIELKVETIRQRGNVWKLSGKASSMKISWRKQLSLQ